LHDALSLSQRDVRVLGPIGQAFVRAMLDVGHDLLLRCAIGSQFVGDDPLRLHTLLLQQPCQKALRRLGVTPGLRDLVENIAILVYRPPQPLLPASHADDDLVEVPDVVPARGFSLQAAREFSPELPGPTTDGFVRDVDPALGQKILDQPQAERETKVQPDGVGNDLWWIAMTLVTDGLLHGRAQWLGTNELPLT
jgi:hypothetical protein